MATKRRLKKKINLICEALFAECVAASLYGPESNKENLNAHAFSIVKLQDNAIRRVSHPEPGIPAKKYYQDLREKFSAQASDILDQLNA